MVDEKNLSPDDEYQFPQEEYVTSNPNELPKNDEFVAADTSDSKKIFSSYQNSLLKNKRFIIIAIVLCVLFLIPFLMDRFNTSKSVNTPAPASTPTPVELPQPTATPQPVVTQAPQPMPEITEPVPQNAQLDNKIQGLQQQVTNMQNSLSQSQASNEALQKSVTQLTQQMQMLSAALQKAQASQQKLPRVKQVVFHLRAIVPDRAWVVTSSGETVSVSVGDSLDQYGTIQSIDPVYGVIETSSGRKITYGSNDF